MKKSLSLLLLGIVFVLGACGSGNDTNEGGETAATAEEIYEANCSACHGADLSGGAGPDLTAVGSKYSQEEIANIITEGIGSMPAQGVSGEELETLSNWLAEKQ